MFRDIEFLRATLTRKRVGLAVGAALLAGLAAAGLRSSGREAGQAAAAQVQPEQTGQQAERPGAPALAELDVSFIPREAQGLLVIRPAALLSRPELSGIPALFAGSERRVALPGEIALADVEQLSLILIPPVQPERATPGALVPFGAVAMRTTKPHDFRKLIDEHAPDAVRIPVGDGEYFSSTVERDLCYFRPDDRTLILGSMQDIARIAAAAAGGREGGWQRLA
ncbi:MAG TPA: hypothetical protein VML55_18420, partial [Planctomycetaceae bacterium]|nr:hypothetical protein [Planctomycetaceae bacterium]